MKSPGYADWLERLRWISDNPALHTAQKQVCVLLGHEPSGERLMTCPPIDVCFWCAAMFRKVEK